MAAAASPLEHFVLGCDRRYRVRLFIIHRSIGKALDQVGVEHQLFKRWGGDGSKEKCKEPLRVVE